MAAAVVMPRARAGRAPVRSRQAEELPGSERAREGQESRERKTAVPDDQQRERDRDRREPDPPHQLRIHQAGTRPNRRSRRWNSRMASKRWRRVKSGQSTGVTYSSA